MKRQARHLVCALVAGAASLQWSSVHAQWHEEFREKDIQAHYVKLVGHAGDNAEKRHLLELDHDACNSVRTREGLAAQPLPPTGIPAIPEPMEQEIYYAPNRTLVAALVQRHYIDPVDCRLVLHEKRVLTLASIVGVCDIDMTAKTARGHCDDAAHRRVSMADARAAILAQRDRMQKLTGHIGGNTATQSKMIARTPCVVVSPVPGGSRECIANPRSEFPIPASTSNRLYPGLLLEVSGRILTLTAQEVTLGLRVSEKLFSIPPGVKVVSTAPSNR